MTLLELSAEYARSEALLRARISRLRAMAKAEPDREAARRLQSRIAALDPAAAGNARPGGADGPLLRKELSQA